jgi:Fe(3+) dicitrate transport protein
MQARLSRLFPIQRPGLGVLLLVKSIPLGLALTVAMSVSARADDAGDRQSLTTKLDRLSVVGSAEKAQEAAGSAHYLDIEQLLTFNYADVHRVLRQVPGVYVVDEEGYGLRPNIGIRGSGTDRNARITVMEDGVLIAPAPYAAASAYYFPTMARMSAVEVRKGSSAIKAGPRTTGGAINLVSTPIPAEQSGLVDLAVGKDASRLGHAWVGGSSDRIGFLVETVQQSSDGFKRLDPGGDTGYSLEDYLGKLRLTADPDAERYQELELKLGRTEQDSDETYLGLTDADFDAHPNRRYAASQLDNITTEHEHTSLRHVIEFSPQIDLTSVVYRNEFARNWYKIDSVNGRSIAAVLANPAGFANEYAWLRGITSPDNALLLRNNNRRYESEGVQSVLALSLAADRASHAIEAGVRWHRDDEDRFQDDDRYRMQDGRLVLTSNGAPGTQDNRVGEAEAWSFFVQDEIRFGNWILTPGLRHESIDLTQTRYAQRPDGRASAPTAIARSSVDAWIPGFGATWLLGETTHLFASVHRGFNPPGPGGNAEPEESVNAEFGLRHAVGAFNGELVGFWNDYDNLVGTCTASTGGGCNIGDQFDGGQATVRGLEASAGWTLGRGTALSLPLELAYTYTDARFDSSFTSAFEEWTTVTRGDELPYLPEHQLHLGAGLEADRWRVNLGLNYLDEMRTRAGQGAAAATLLTDAVWLLDLSGAYRLSDAAELYARLENATDEAFIVSRRPAGARPGRPRSGFVGVRVRF